MGICLKLKCFHFYSNSTLCSTCMCIHTHTNRTHQCAIRGCHGFCHCAIGFTPIMFLQKWILIQWSCIICISLQEAEQDSQQPPKGRKNVIQTVQKECLCLKLYIYTHTIASTSHYIWCINLYCSEEIDYINFLMCQIFS